MNALRTLAAINADIVAARAALATTKASANLDRAERADRLQLAIDELCAEEQRTISALIASVDVRIVSRDFDNHVILNEDNEVIGRYSTADAAERAYEGMLTAEQAAALKIDAEANAANAAMDAAERRLSYQR